MMQLIRKSARPLAAFLALLLALEVAPALAGPSPDASGPGDRRGLPATPT